MRTFLLFILLAPLSLFVTAQEENAFAGVWQQTQVAGEDGHTMRLPVWKVLQNDGTFCTFLIANQMAQTIITNAGTYEVASENSYKEHITGSITDPGLVGHTNDLTYSFDGPDKLTIVYTMPGAEREAVETWVRVKLEFPQQPPHPEPGR